MLEKFFGEHSKHPLTVRVSNPNSFLKIKDNDSLCIEIYRNKVLIGIMYA